jgi:class 3 adenylate cyclase
MDIVPERIMAIQPSSRPRLQRLLVAFTDVDSFWALAKRLGDDLNAFAFMDGYTRAVVEALGDRARVIKWMGDEYIAVAEDPDAGVRALLEAKAAGEAYLTTSGLPTTIRLQAHIGEVACGPFGPEGHFDVYGEAVNRAASVMRERKAGAFALSPEAFRSLSGETRKLFRRQTPAIIYLAR